MNTDGLRIPNAVAEGRGEGEKESLSFEMLLSSPVRRVRPVCTYNRLVWPAYAAYERKSITNETHVPRRHDVRLILPFYHTHIRETRRVHSPRASFSRSSLTWRTNATTVTTYNRRRLRRDWRHGAVAAAAKRRRPSSIFARFRRVRRSLPPAADDASAAARFATKIELPAEQSGAGGGTPSFSRSLVTTRRGDAARFRRERRAVTRYYMHLRESHRETATTSPLFLSLLRPVHHSRSGHVTPGINSRIMCNFLVFFF